MHSQYGTNQLLQVARLGRLAQLVQSTSFTPRGSGVRTPHRPQKFKKRHWKQCRFFLYVNSLSTVITTLIRLILHLTHRQVAMEVVAEMVVAREVQSLVGQGRVLPFIIHLLK